MAKKARSVSNTAPLPRLLLFNDLPTQNSLVRYNAEISGVLRPGEDRRVLRIRGGEKEKPAILNAVDEVFRRLSYRLVSDSPPDSLKSLAGIWLEGSDIAELRKGISSMSDLSAAIFNHGVPYIGVLAGAELAGLSASDNLETLAVIDAHVRTGLPTIEGQIADSYRLLSGTTRKTVFALLPKSVARLDSHGVDVETRVIDGTVLICRPGNYVGFGIGNRIDFGLGDHRAEKPHSITAEKGYRGFVPV